MTRPASSDLPGHRPFRISVICSGNICRSPIGEQLLEAAIRDAGLAGQVQVTSAGTGDWPMGQSANPQALSALARAGVNGTDGHDHRAHRITATELADIDLALAADRGHVQVLRRMTDNPDKVVLLRTFDPAADGNEIPDPYQGPDDGYDAVVAMTAAAIPGILTEIRTRLAHQEVA